MAIMIVSLERQLSLDKRARVAKVFSLIGRSVTVVTEIARIIGPCRDFI